MKYITIITILILSIGMVPTKLKAQKRQKVKVVFEESTNKYGQCWVFAGVLNATDKPGNTSQNNFHVWTEVFVDGQFKMLVMEDLTLALRQYLESNATIDVKPNNGFFRAGKADIISDKKKGVIVIKQRVE